MCNDEQEAPYRKGEQQAAVTAGAFESFSIFLGSENLLLLLWW